jgi:hypothetical protein
MLFSDKRMNTIYIPRRELHLAAFIKSLGTKFITFQDECFVFESNIQEVILRVQHSNSEALKVDRELFTLKAFLNKNKVSIP